MLSQAVSAVKGHGFVTEYAQPTNPNENYTYDPVLSKLESSYSYLTRMSTSIAPAQINLDPTFVPATGLPPVAATHYLNTFADKECPVSAVPTIVTASLGGVLVIVLALVIFVVVRRRRRGKAHSG